jgi:hypothetical protein
MPFVPQLARRPHAFIVDNMLQTEFFTDAATVSYQF